MGGGRGSLGQGLDGLVQLVQGRGRRRIVLLEQGFAGLAGRAQLRHATVAGGAMQPVDPLEQSGAVVVVAGLANRLAARRSPSSGSSTLNWPSCGARLMLASDWPRLSPVHFSTTWANCCSSIGLVR